MTIEEAKQMADQGDIGAMCSLGDFYIKQNTGEGIKEASKWYELAARKNVIYAIHMTVLSKKILAYSGLQVVAGYESEESVDFVKKNWEEVYDWASQEIEMLDDNVPGSEKIDIKQAVENYNDAIYYLALCNYELRNYDVVITLLKDIDRNGNEGIGKPEPLIGNLSGFWSRRINEKDRLIYKIDEYNIYILSCRYHYSDT